MNKKKILESKKEKKIYVNNLFSEEQKNQIFSIVTDYANSNPDMLNNSFKKITKKEELNNKIKSNIFKTLEKVIITSVPRTTSPDELTSLYLENYCGHKKTDRNLYIDGYQVQKKAEMSIGELLELYIQTKLFKHGWCCSGTVIEDVDFVRKVGDKWKQYQIKNSDNTENKAASKTRDKHSQKKINIQKWARRNSVFGLESYLKEKKIINSYYWSKFPKKGIKEKLTEKNFRKFIKEYFQNISLKNI